MNDKNINLKENAKDDWLTLAKKHRRKQKGLPALSKLNTNAGNVEHNVSMFNHMNTPTGGPTNNPVSGPFGENVSASSAGEGMGESIKKKTFIKSKHEKLDDVFDMSMRTLL